MSQTTWTTEDGNRRVHYTMEEASNNTVKVTVDVEDVYEFEFTEEREKVTEAYVEAYCTPYKLRNYEEYKKRTI